MNLRFVFPLALILFPPAMVSAEEIAPMALNGLGAVPAKIVGAPVKDTHGAVVGQVAKIETDAMGKPLRVDVTLTGGPMVFLAADTLGYDENANVLVTALDRQQLVQMPDQPRG